MSDFTPTAFRAEQKGARMVAIYATVGGEDVFVGSSLNGGGYDAADKIKWVTDALEAHYGLTGAKPKKAKATKAAPAKVAIGKKAKAVATKKPLAKKGK